MCKIGGLLESTYIIRLCENEVFVHTMCLEQQLVRSKNSLMLTVLLIILLELKLG